MFARSVAVILRSGGAPFGAGTVPGLVNWWDATVPANVRNGAAQAEDTEIVTAVVDAIDPTNNLAASANHPTLDVDAANGLQGILFDGVANKLTCGVGTDASTACTLFAVIKSDPADTAWVLVNEDFQSKYLGVAQSGGTGTDHVGFAAGTPTLKVNGAALPAENRGGFYTAASGILSIVRIENIDFSAWRKAPTQVEIGAYPDPFPFAGHWFEMLIYDRALNAGEIVTVEEAYLAPKFGITLP